MNNMITEDEVRSITLSKRDYDNSKFTPHLQVAEVEFIKSFLGKALYSEIVSQYQTDSYSTLNALLVNNYLKKPLAWYVLHKALPFIHMDIANAGIRINTTEYASSGTDKQRSDLVSTALNNGNTFLKIAKEYIEDAVTILSYPLYSKMGNVSNEVRTIGGIILDTDDDFFEDKRNFFNPFQ